MRDRIVSDEVIERMEACELPLTGRELDRAAQNISALAKLHGVPETEIRSGISNAIQVFCDSQNPRAQALKKTLPGGISAVVPESFHCRNGGTNTQRNRSLFFLRFCGEREHMAPMN